MNDDQIRDALDRRSRSAQFRADELLPGVRRGIGVSRQPARFARWASLAGLAAAAVIVVALVIAFPGGRGAGGASPSPSSSLDVMTTQEFATALAAGSLDGQTVLVDGGIVQYDGPANTVPVCGVFGPACLIGQVDGVVPRVAVYAHDIAVQGTAPIESGSEWQSWEQLQPPIEGTLVLSVDDAGAVTYIGRVVPNGDQNSWSAGQVKSQLDLNARELDDAVLVNGWLTGVEIPTTCAAPLTPPAFPVLPSRHECGLDSWIDDEPDALAAQSDNPVSAIEVQPDAFATYARDPNARNGESLMPQRAIYVVAKRLYGTDACILSTQPCFDWSVVGRLSQPAPDVAPPSLQPVATPEIAPPPTPSDVPKTPLPTGPVSNKDSSGDFALSITSPKSVYSADEAIDVQAALSYNGGGSSAVLSGSGSGLVVFGVKQVDGDLAVDGIWTADCQLGGYSLTPGNPMNIPFAKSGGFDANGPGADFDKTYFGDPLLHLPAGHWQIYAASDFYIGSSCDGDDVMMRATIEIDVIGDQGTLKSHLPTDSPSPVLVPTGYTVSVAPGVQPQSSAANFALAAVDSMYGDAQLLGRSLAQPQVVSVQAMRGADVPSKFSGPWPGVPIAWVVHVLGTYVQSLPGRPPVLASDGFVVYDDSGHAIGDGTFDCVPYPSDLPYASEWAQVTQC